MALIPPDPSLTPRGGRGALRFEVAAGVVVLIPILIFEVAVGSVKGGQRVQPDCPRRVEARRLRIARGGVWSQSQALPSHRLRRRAPVPHHEVVGLIRQCVFTRR